MKKSLMLLVLMLITAPSSAALACTKAQPNGSAGNANVPATGFITDVVANGSPVLTITYAHTVQSALSFYSTNVSIAGAWHADVAHPVITLFAIKPAAGYNATIDINSVHVFAVSGVAIIGNGRFFNGPGGGMTGITGLGVGQESFTIDGVNNGVANHGNFRTSSPPDCTYAVQDLGAVGLTLMPQGRMRQEWWMSL